MSPERIFNALQDCFIPATCLFVWGGATGLVLCLIVQGVADAVTWVTR